uniref:L-ascorbate peroxidase n=1 Tax=Chlamydomonas euryale TaxID=1486919 RepID=A0A7R9VXF3_9CHLO|mmetsp:Transcript_6251/g.19325  ORF Transcript_6251/g.19325 Transcript_6251/m.19325 type:complete len:320 (+) Transcript_6251:65-1024(+)
MIGSKLNAPRASMASRSAAPLRGAARTVRRVAVVPMAKAAEATYMEAKAECAALIKKTSCAPIIVRLAWHDSGNYDASTKTGGANASIRFEPEMKHGGNAGLPLALKLLEPIKKKFPDVSYADLFQMASATAIEVSGGPKIDMKYGRVDAADESFIPPEGRLPNAAAPFQEAQGPEPNKEAKDQTPQGHLRRVFGRMGLSDKDIVALSGAHTLGRAFKNRSGAAPLESTKYTKDGPGTKGGQSWTEEWLKFDNRYFTMLLEAEAGTCDPELLQMATDNALLTDPEFRPLVEKYAKDNAAFCADYAEAHKRLSELGSTFE